MYEKSFFLPTSKPNNLFVYNAGGLHVLRLVAQYLYRIAFITVVYMLDTIATENLEIAKEHQNGRVAEDATVVSIDFSERWFRELLKLTADIIGRLSKNLLGLDTI